MEQEIFIDGIQSMKRGMITFFSDKDERMVTRECAPLDIGPRRKNGGACDEYIDKGRTKAHFYDFDGTGGGHITSKNLEDIEDFELLADLFNPDEIITWELRCPWFIERNW